MYIVEFENGGNPWWLDGSTGDPGRTVVRKNAQIFTHFRDADFALRQAIKKNPHRKLATRGIIIPLYVSGKKNEN